MNGNTFICMSLLEPEWNIAETQAYSSPSLRMEALTVMGDSGISNMDTYSCTSWLGRTWRGAIIKYVLRKYERKHFTENNGNQPMKEGHEGV